MKINRALLPIKLHYFLRYAGATFLVMGLPLIVRQKGVSAQGIGFLWTIMPIVGLITNSVSGALADYFRVHKTVFLLSVVFLTAGLVSMYVLPDMPENVEPVREALRNLTSFSKPLNDPHNLTMPKGVVDILPNITSPLYAQSAAHVTTVNLTKPSATTVTRNDLLLNPIDPEMVIEEGQVFPPNLEISTAREPLHSVESSTLSYLMSFPQFWLICIAMMIEQMGLSVCVMISDAVCFQILGTDRHKYGQQRLWGTIGMGIMSIVTGAFVDMYSKGLPQTDYLPAVIICIVLMTSDLILVARINIPSSQGSKLKMGDVGHVLIHPQTILFIVTVYIMGTSLGSLWVYKLMHIEDVANVWDSKFSNLRLLQGLDLGIESFGGEVPFFFLSGMIIQRLGHNGVLALSLGTTALRCCLYYTVSNPWWFLPIEFLNGISYGLFYAGMASYASYIAPPGAQATLQAIVMASLRTGYSTAGFVGGALYQTIGGASMFLCVGIFDVIYCILFIILQFLIDKYVNHKKPLGNSEYIAPTSYTPPLSQDSSGDIQNDNREEKDTKQSLMEDV